MTQPAPVYIFLDEGGNFDFSPGGTKYFTLTSVLCSRPFPFEQALLNLRYELLENGSDIERFHASDDRQAVRDQVFHCLSDSLSTLRIDSLVVEKRKTGPSLRADSQFYPKMLGYLLKYVFNGREIEGASQVIVITDSLPHRKKRASIEKAIKKSLGSMLPANTPYQVLHHESRASMGLQVADYCNWAVFRKWTRSDLRSYDLIRSSIVSEFDIFQHGDKIWY